MMQNVLSLDESLSLLRSMGNGNSIDIADAETLIDPVKNMAAHCSDRVCDEVALAVISSELGVLNWQPMDGTRLVNAFLAVASSRDVTILALNYISLYYPELDEVIGECRHEVAAGASHREVNLKIAAAIEGVENFLV